MLAKTPALTLRDVISVSDGVEKIGEGAGGDQECHQLDLQHMLDWPRTLGFQARIQDRGGSQNRRKWRSWPIIIAAPREYRAVVDRLTASATNGNTKCHGNYSL